MELPQWNAPPYRGSIYNCFIELADPARPQALADAQHQTDWLQLLGQLLAPAHPLQAEMLKLSLNLFYYWSVTQSVYATDLCFEDPRQLAGVYPALVMRGLRTFQSLDVMRFLDHRMPVTTGRLDAPPKRGADRCVKLT